MDVGHAERRGNAEAQVWPALSAIWSKSNPKALNKSESGCSNGLPLFAEQQVKAVWDAAKPSYTCQAHFNIYDYQQMSVIYECFSLAEVLGAVDFDLG